jgi:REP element-mobilizing transposase RayT
MPEHLHLLLLPPDAWQLGIEIGKLKSRIASRLIVEQPDSLASFLDQLEIVKDYRRRLAVWTPRRFDRNLRHEDAVRTRIDYCHANPVKRGLVTDPGDWVWSSYRWYEGMKDVPLEMDEL